MYILCPAEPNFNKFHKKLSGSAFLFTEMFHIQFKNIFKFLDFRGMVVLKVASLIPWGTGLICSIMFISLIQFNFKTVCLNTAPVGYSQKLL